MERSTETEYKGRTAVQAGQISDGETGYFANGFHQCSVLYPGPVVWMLPRITGKLTAEQALALASCLKAAAEEVQRAKRSGNDT